MPASLSLVACNFVCVPCGGGSPSTGNGCMAKLYSREVVIDHVGGFCRLGLAFYWSDVPQQGDMEKEGLVKSGGLGRKMLWLSGCIV